MTPYGDRDLGEHWLRQGLDAWRHQAITWTNVDLPSVRSIDIHLSTILQEILQPSITKITWKITSLKFLWNLPEVNELMFGCSGSSQHGWLDDPMSGQVPFVLIMMMSSNGNIFCITGPLWDKGQWHGALMFPLICIFTNGQADNRDASDLRCHHAHYDITVMPAGATTRIFWYNDVKTKLWMSWFLVLLDYQQPWNWLCKEIPVLHKEGSQLPVSYQYWEWCQYSFMFPKINWTWQGLIF